MDVPEPRALAVRIPQTHIAGEVMPVVQFAQAVVVSNQQEYDDATGKLRTIASLQKRIDEIFDPVVKAGHEAHKAALDAKNVFAKPLESARKQIASVAGAWYDREQRRAEEERRRKQAEVDAEAEKERQRLAKQAANAMKKGDVEKAAELLDKKEATVAPAVFSQGAPQTNQSGVSTRENWDAELADEKLIPREWLVPDWPRIKAEARRVKSERSTIPGVKFVKQVGFAARRSL